MVKTGSELAVPAGVHLYVRRIDKSRLEAIASLETRSVAHQLEVILNEACERRSRDPETAEPCASQNPTQVPR